MMTTPHLQPAAEGVRVGDQDDAEGRLADVLGRVRQHVDEALLVGRPEGLHVGARDAQRRL
jgi:hypothetical protein